MKDFEQRGSTVLHYEARVADIPVGNDRSIVLVVEDDPLVRASLEALLRSADLKALIFSSPGELIQQPLPQATSCLLADVQLPGANGFELQQTLRTRGEEIPIIFMTGYGDVSMSVRAMKAGAIDFLTKPFVDRDLLEAVLVALDKDRARRSRLAYRESLMDRFKRLSKREREVLDMVVDGGLNKQIAFHLGISEVTVKLHRSNGMRKLETPTLPHLTRLFEEVRCFDLVARPRSGTDVREAGARLVSSQGGHGYTARPAC